MKRRQFLRRTAYGLAGFTAFVGYSSWRGFRYPPLMYVLGEQPNQIDFQQSELIFKDAIPLLSSSVESVLPSQLEGSLLMRAIAPEPVFQIAGKEGSVIKLMVNNLHTDALPDVTGGELIDYEVKKTNQLVSVKIGNSEQAVLKWTFLRPESYRIATIGDTGGDKELGWCLKKATEFNADFMLHLGDFVYQDGDYERSISYFQNSDIPCYVTVGNHDFHHKGKIFQPFLDSIGQFNHTFELGALRVVNYDTANDFFPPWAGQRGKMLGQLEKYPQGVSGKVKETIAFTHRPLQDSRPGEDHDVNGVKEAEWLMQKLNKLGVSKLLAGHVHIKSELDVEGIHQYIAGQGMGAQDLILKDSVAEMLLFDITESGLTQADWRFLDMPLDLHCNTRHQPAFEELNRMDEYWAIQKLCGR